MFVPNVSSLRQRCEHRLGGRPAPARLALCAGQPGPADAASAADVSAAARAASTDASATAPPAASPYPIAEEGARLLAWARQQGAETVALAIVRFPPSQLRGVVALEALPAGRPLVRLPARMALHTRSDSGHRACPLPSRFCSPTFWSTCPWWVRLALMLLFERFKEDAQKRKFLEAHILQRPLRIWERDRLAGTSQAAQEDVPMRATWSNALPDAFDTTPLHWDADERAALQYAFLEQAVAEQQKQWDALYRRYLVSTFGSSSSDHGRWSGGADWRAFTDRITREEFYWALECARSRAFSGPCESTPFRDRVRLAAFSAALALSSWSFGWLQSDVALQAFLVLILAQSAYDFLYPRILKHTQGIELRKYVIAPVIDMFNHTSTVQSDVRYEFFYDAFVLAVTNRGFAPGEQVFISYGPRSNDELLLTYGFVEEHNPHDKYTVVDAERRTLVVLEHDGTVRDRQRVIEQYGSVKALRCLLQSELDAKPTTVEQDEAYVARSEREELARRFRLCKKRILRQALARLADDEVH